VAVETDWRVTGTSKPSQVEYNISQEIPDKYKFEDELGEEVFHVYDVKNRGPSTIQEAEVFILWPSFNENKDHLLYLLGVEYDTSRVTCEQIGNINPLYVKTIGSRGYAAAAAQSGMDTSSTSSSSSSSSSFSSESSEGASNTHTSSSSGGGRWSGGAGGSGVYGQGGKQIAFNNYYEL
jgi:integrin alpha 8